MPRGSLLVACLAWVGLVATAACSSDDRAPASGSGGSGGSAVADASALDAADAPSEGAEAEAEASSPCPSEMVLVDAFCIDRYEAPNREAELPLVMFTFDEAEAWCAARSKRLCFDDEWTRSCAGTAGSKYPYGDTHLPGTCNDDETWLTYDQSALNGWPWTVSQPEIESLAELLEATHAVSASAGLAADHVEWLYQAEPSGKNSGCVGPDGVFDLEGNVEEWTRRRDGGSGPDFSGSLKGRYWAEPRTCQNAVTNHGNGFRFYEIGFRCCQDPSPP